MTNELLEFPRGTVTPKQSPLHWVDQKDRYLRQLMIRDIEALTGRSLLVYFTDCDTNAQIDPNDDKYLLELLSGAQSAPVDLFLETNGGVTDATEKLVAILRAQANDLRVIVPRRAKSNGTLLALAAKEIVMGPGSELGPIDPNLMIQNTPFPCQFILQMQNPDPLIYQLAQYAVMQTRKLAKPCLL
jgi:membrane-bound ClpP family serine protease